MSIEISFAHDRMQIDVIHDVLRQSYWSPGIRREVIEAAIANSMVIGAFETGSNRQVGFARVVTDHASFAWLCDVFVIESHQGRGIAKRMLQALLEHPKLTTLRRWCLATRDAHGLYAQLGFTPIDASRWMELKRPVNCWQESQ